MFLYLKIVYRNLKNDEWWIDWEINPTFWNRLKVTRLQYKMCKIEKKHKKELQDIENGKSYRISIKDKKTNKEEYVFLLTNKDVVVLNQDGKDIFLLDSEKIADILNPLF